MQKFAALLLASSLLITTLATRAQDIPPRPNPPTRVNDLAHVMTPDQIDALERKLVAYNDSTTSDIVVVTVPDIGNSTVDDYALQILRTWGVGDKKNNNGIVILADIKDRKVAIQVGYGLEGAIPDVTAKSIIENEIVPNFREGGTDNYYRGFDQAADALIKAAAGEYKAPEGYAQGRHRVHGTGNGIGAVLVILIVIIVIIARRGGGGRGGGGYYGGGGWLPFLFGTMVGRGLGGGGGGGWGGGGGGWSGGGGFGGGSGGGGGASGSW
ncbi:MAG TPA: TPM domain-containing protein [Puia sp.]|nr:TPM domain-containing protein [Puia sp.]